MNIRLKRRPGNRILVGLIILYALSQSACGPTYPKEIVDKAIVQLCREEYNIDVKVKIVGNAVGVYIPIQGLFDATLNISKEAAEKINDVLLSVSRVTLSTDAPLDFYIVVAQDSILPEIEVVLIRYIKDIKLLHYEQISRGEFTKRMIIDIKLTPQAQKEKVLRDIFTRLNMGKEADMLIAEYLKTGEVTSIGDIGYWQNTFYIKEIGMGEFLGLQIADRVKAKFIAPPLREKFKLNLIKGEYLKEGGKDFFRFSFDIASLDKSVPFVSQEDIDIIYKEMLDSASNVLYGYKFNEFWNIEIVNTATKQVLFATYDELEEFRKKKIGLEELRRWYR